MLLSRRCFAMCCLALAVLSLVLPAGAEPAGVPIHVKIIAILDFENLTDQKSGALGRNAADAVILALPNDRYEVVDRELVEKKMQSLGMRPPLDLHALGRIGKDLKNVLDVEEVFVGKVLRADVRKGTPKQASVRLDVRVFDVAAQEFTSGAVADGASSPRYEDAAGSVLVDEAINKAATGAAYKITTQTIPEGTVLLNKLGEVLINIGAQHGVKTGMEFIALRGPKGQDEKVGRVQVVSTTSRDCCARIKEEIKGITTDDRVRAVYVPGMIRAPGAAANRKVTGVYVCATVNLLLMTQNMKRRGKTQVNYSVEGTTARAALSGDNRPAIKVTWKKPATAAVDLLGYQVYRSTTQYGNYVPVDEVDGPAETVFLDTTENRTVAITQDGQSDAKGDTAETEDVDVIGVVPGVTYYYRVRRIFVETVPQESGGEVRFRVTRSDLSPPTPGATPLLRPTTQRPAAGESVDTAGIPFRWLSVAGGDGYRIQVSDTPDFPPARTYNSPDGDARLVLPGGAAGHAMSVTLNVSAYFPAKDPVTGQPYKRRLLWRVGACHARDGMAPEGGFLFSPPTEVLCR